MSAKKYESRAITKPLHCQTTARIRRFMTMAAMPLLFSLLTVATTRGQSALDGFDPNADGAINVFVVQPDGKILLGGSFTTLSPNGGAPVTRSHMARLNPDGTLDAAFNPNATGAFSFVKCIVLQPDGKILVGGVFDNIGGQPRHNIARLDPITGLADSFDPNANAVVRSIVLQADGKILVGGNFDGANSIGGQTRNGIARLDPVTGFADSFNPNCNGEVYVIVVLPSGKILVGGFFSNIGAQIRLDIARLDAVTGLADAFNPSASREVITIALQHDGKILVGGHFTSIGGQGRNYIARLDPNTGLADSFNPNANEEVDSIAVQADSKILVGGFFRGANSIGGQTRNCMARIDATTGLADSFDPNGGGGIPGNDAVFSIALQADGKILTGGNFTTLSPNGGTAVTRNRIARLENDGRLDRTLDAGISGSEVNATAVGPDGKIFVGGFFQTFFGVIRRNIARLNTDGSLDPAFDASANGNVYAIAVQPDGKILVGGQFSGIGLAPRSNIARLDAAGLADSFNPNVFGDVYSIVLQADGKVLVGGFFSSVGGQSRHNIARVNADGTLDTSFNPNADNIVLAITLQPDGRILVGGFFAGIGGEARNRLARLDPATGLADSFDPNGNDFVAAIAVQVDGKILAGGQFTQIGGQPRNRLARLDATTGLADSFNPDANGQVRSITMQTDGKIFVGGDFTSVGGQTRNRSARLDVGGLADFFDPNANGTVVSLTVQPDGKILIGGQFTATGGQTRNRFARLSNDTPAFQDLAVTQTTITWTRGGSSPQFTRTTFEISGDNLNYTLLGNGVAGGGNWTLTGLALPTGFHFYIRARGYYSSGEVNGSGSIAESVRENFLPGPITTPTPSPTPPATPTPTPTPTPTATPATPTPTPSATPTPTPSPSASPTPTATPGTLGNISTRVRVLSGDNALIGGMIATGTAGKRVIIRAIGPSLTPLGVPGALANPTLDLFQGSTLLFSNDDWNNSTQQAEIANSGLAPGNTAEAAIIWTLAPGQGYTAVVRGQNGTTGVGIVEVYDLDQAAASKLGNISTRGFVDVDDNVMIAGLIAGPGNGTSLKVLVRALGPTLSDLGVPGALANPTLDLVNSSGTVIRSNNDWKDDPLQRAAIEAAGLAPGHDEEAALVETVAPGAYTAIVRGSGRTTGVGLVEAYNIP
jgi:uncharacterized delta-60 repeat protein